MRRQLGKHLRWGRQRCSRACLRFEAFLCAVQSGSTGKGKDGDAVPLQCPTDAKTVSEVFELPENIIPVMMFAMGYPSERAKPNAWHCKRMPIEYEYSCS